MIRRLKSGKYQLYSHKRTSRAGTRGIMGSFNTRTSAEWHKQAIQRKGKYEFYEFIFA